MNAEGITAIQQIQNLNFDPEIYQLSKYFRFINKNINNFF